MKFIFIAALALTACSKDIDTAAVNAQVIVTPSAYEFLGKEYADIQQLKVAIEEEPHLELSLLINEEQACVDAERIAKAVELLRARDPNSGTFIGSSSTDACKR